MLLIAALIEARFCERFEILHNHIEDDELSRFYGSLFESEANHYATYVQLAYDFAPAMEVSQRLHQLATEASNSNRDRSSKQNIRVHRTFQPLSQRVPSRTLS